MEQAMQPEMDEADVYVAMMEMENEIGDPTLNQNLQLYLATLMQFSHNDAAQSLTIQKNMLIGEII
jgi:hypothetical protein